MKEEEIVGFAVRRKCMECHDKFNSIEVLIGHQLMLTDLCVSCRDKYKALPDILPKYILEDILETPRYISAA